MSQNLFTERIELAADAIAHKEPARIPIWVNYGSTPYVVDEEFGSSYKDVLYKLHRAQMMGEMAARGRFGHLTIAFSEDLYIEDHFTDLLEDIRESFEGLTLEFTKIPMQDMQDYLLTRQGDFVVSLHLSLMDCPELDVIDLFPIECFILMSRDHPLAVRDHLEPNALINETIYLPEPVKCYSIFNNDFCGLTIDRNKLIPTSTIDIALLNTRFSGGVTCANSLMHASYNEQLYRKFKVPDPAHVPNVALAWSKNATNPAIPFFRDLAKAFF